MYRRFHGFPALRGRDGRAVPGSGLARPRSADRDDVGRRPGRAGGRARQLRASARPCARGGRVRGRGRPPGSGSGHPPARAAGGHGRRRGHRDVRRRGHAGERADAARLRRRRVRRLPPARGRDDRGAARDRADGGIPCGGRRARPRRRRRVAGAVLRTADRGRRRRVDPQRFDRRRALPQHPGLELRRDRLPRQPEGRLGGRCPGVSVGRRHPRLRRPGRLLRSGRARSGRGGGGDGEGDAGVVRDLRRLRRDRRRRRPSPGAAARQGPGTRRPPDRPELPRDLRGRPGPERDVRAAHLPCRQHRLLFPERRARTGRPRARGRARARALGLRLGRQQGGRLVERPARVLGGRPRDRPDPALPRVVRQSAQVRAPGAPRRAQEADPGDEGGTDVGRPAGGRLAHGRARRVDGGGRGPLPAGGRGPGGLAGRARRRSRPALVAAASPGTPGGRC